MGLKAGDVIEFNRMFTKEDVEIFTKFSKDEGQHHTNPDELDRLVVQGLLTATLPTKVGGDHHVLARTMSFEFLRPVFTGDTINCAVTIEKYEKKDERKNTILATFQCVNQLNLLVMTGHFAGVIFTNAMNQD